MVELVRLAGQEETLRARIDEVSRAARAASAELAAAKEALVELEREAAAGKVTATARKESEQRLDRAEQAAGQRWAERSAGAERAAQDARAAIQVHIAANFDAIVDELEENGRAGAQQVDHTAQGFLDACGRRAEAEQNLISITALVRAMGPNDVTRTRTDAARQAVAEFVQRGGEQPPELRIAERMQAA
jgi:hypothetical protein